MRRYQGQLIYQGRSQAGRIEVVEDQHTRSLHFGDHTRQSTMYLDHPVVLVLAYTRAMMGCLLFDAEPRAILLLGLGGGSLAKFLLHHYPDCHMDVVEPRADVVQVAREHFALPHGPRLRIHVSDGLSFLKGAPGDFCGYDLVLVDAYDHTGLAPSVTQPDFFAAARDRLGPQGILAINLSRSQKALYRQALRSLRKGFPRGVLRLPVIEKGNEIALALRDPAPLGSLKQLEGRARALRQRTGLEFPDFLDQLRRHNIDFQRLIPA